MSRSDVLHGNTKVYGYRNCAFHNRNPTGDEVWFLTREERTKALEATREFAQAAGLSQSAATNGIYPVSARARQLSDDELTVLEDRIEFGS